ncbi:uncharacterized protein LOC127256907 [Andrographis paniculata]|uniref:uncharacterized protein LOC127256907 n=1 Tax=Andrographis paniculata TaxID=175694 RepID=UPI0021E89E03|nr:uncharacterized protein LOC127256907 [Andrographis paniculata]
MHLVSMSLVHTIASENAATSQDRAKAIIFIRHHLDIPLQFKYLTVKDPLDLWNELREKFGHLKYITLPKARHDCLNLRLQDFKNITEYNSAIHHITSQLKLSGEIVTENDKLEKTLYLSCFECCAATTYVPLSERDISERGRGRGRGHGRGHGCESQHGRYTPYNRRSFDINMMQSKPQYGDIAEKAKQGKRQIGICNRCGIEGHWANTCKTAKHLADLYQASLQKKEKKVETNYVDNDDDPDDDLLDYDTTHLDIADFFVDLANPQ